MTGRTPSPEPERCTNLLNCPEVWQYAWQDIAEVLFWTWWLFPAMAVLTLGRWWTEREVDRD